VEHVALRAFDVVAGEPAVEPHVADHRLERRTPSRLASDRGRDLASTSGDRK
jgi:hypothetical protein